MDKNVILTNSSVISAVVQHRENCYKFDKHIHNTMELYRILSGECRMDINNRTISCKKDDIVMIMPNTVHSFYLPTNSPCEFQHIHFSPALFSKLYLKEDNVSETDLITATTLANNFFYHTTSDGNLSYLISSIIEKSSSPSGIAKAYMNLHIAELLLHIFEESESSVTPRKLSASKNTYVSFTLSYIHENYAEKILISNISNMLHISSRYLSKIFFEKMNITISNYINVYRLNQAIDLMLHTNMSLTDISVQIGLKDSQHFSKLFHNIIGITPYKYKKMIQNTDND